LKKRLGSVLLNKVQKVKKVAWGQIVAILHFGFVMSKEHKGIIFFQAHTGEQTAALFGEKIAFKKAVVQNALDFSFIKWSSIDNMVHIIHNASQQIYPEGTIALR